jgi:long-chain acyl-CoA synthetase
MCDALNLNLCGEDTTTNNNSNISKVVKMGSDKSSVIEWFKEHVEKTPNRVYMTQPMGGSTDNIKTWTFAEALDESMRMAGYLESLGLEPGSKIALCSKNCAWWIMADLAIMLSGHVSVPVYPTLTADTVSYTLEHSEAKLIFVGKLDKAPWDEMQKGVPADMPVVAFPMCPEGSTFQNRWADLVKANEPIKSPVDRKPEDLATIIYTSGSTGRPKGVMLNFKVLLHTALSLGPILKVTTNDRMLSYLPLAHTMERWCVECNSFVHGVAIWFADKLSTFRDDLVRAKPTLFLSVPRLYTKFQQGVYKKFSPEKLNLLFSIPIISHIVKKKILKTLGLNHVRFAGSGSAPIPAELIAWYHRLGLELLEGYGMTENFSYSHITKPGRGKCGYVGEPYDDVQQRIAEDGEIQVKTPGLMMGYYKNPEATAEVITEDGWLRTGDKGEIDDQNRLKITGRTKEIFKTSKGKYVAPAPIESKLIVHQRIELACVGGASFEKCHAVLQLSQEARDEISADASKKDVIEKELEALIKQVNSTLDDHEHIGFLVVAHDEWLPENGMLTPTQKIKRAAIEEKYSSNNETWYASGKKVIWYEW